MYLLVTPTGGITELGTHAPAPEPDVDVEEFESFFSSDFGLKDSIRFCTEFFVPSCSDAGPWVLLRRRLKPRDQSSAEADLYPVLAVYVILE